MRQRSMPTRAAAILACVAALAAFAVAPAAAKPKTEFRPGLYVGRTSQGEPVKLRVKACGKGQCLASPNENTFFDVSMSCPSSGETSKELVFLSGESISAAGKVNAPEDGFAKVTAKFQVDHNGSLTGKISAGRTLENGARCASGPVSLTAKIGGTTK
ncbi:MAG TPA: hypothetical protein VMF55_07665 [Solirubrobacterales bacterium]|nr:hypothetical protein [Solirubrobacterales bacterium]